MSSLQVQQAEAFVKEHAIRIQQLRKNLLDVGADLIALRYKAPDRADRASAAARARENEDLSGMFRAVRGLAVWFVEAQDSAAFWDWVDGAGHYFDATGTRWPYMTAEGRLNHVSWLEQHVAHLRRALAPSASPASCCGVH